MRRHNRVLWARRAHSSADLTEKRKEWIHSVFHLDLSMTLFISAEIAVRLSHECVIL